MQIAKIFIIGAGNIGASCAEVMVRKQLGDVYLYDIQENFALGQAMDINQASPAWNSDSRVTGCNYINDLKDSDFVIITAGAPRKEGMTRIDLLKKNKRIINDIGTNIMSLCPDAKVLLITNPVDVLTWYLKNQWPDLNVFGLGCSLDSMRFKYFISEVMGVSVDTANGIVIGTHNNNMIPLVNYATVGGIPITNFLSDKELQKIVDDTKEAGTAIVEMLKDRSGFYAASSVISQIIESMLYNKLDIFPLNVPCSDEYGYKDICLALPAIVDNSGIKKILTIELHENEKKALAICAEEMYSIINKM